MRAPITVTVAVAVVAVAAGIVVAAGLVSSPSSAAASPATCFGHRATIVGTPGDDVLHGTRGRDVIVGRSGDDVIDGGRGADLVCGGKDEDSLRGGRGADRLHGGGDRYVWQPDSTSFLGDHLDGGPGDDLLDAGYDDSREAGDHGGTFDELVFARGNAVVVDLAAGTSTGQGHDTIVGSPELAVAGSVFGDVLRGDAETNWLYGGAGDDRVLGRDGNDRLWEADGDVDSGADVLDGGGGDDALSTRSGADTLRGGIQRDEILVSGAEKTTVDGGAGNDRVSYLPVVGGSVVDGGPGTDVLRLSPASATPLDLDMTAGTLIQGDQQVTVLGFDRWWVDAEQITVRGTEGPDYLEVVRASTTMELLGGDDRVVSGDGDDTVDGGAGSDYADLGGGTNSCTSVENGPC